MKMTKNALISGFKWTLLISSALIFLPPLLVGLLPVWPDAKYLALHDKRLIDACKSPVTVELSRWLYTYKFSGESGNAAFNGHVIGHDCEKKFRITLKKKASVWEIDQVVLNQ